jgi:hypothetical protein
MTTTNIEFPDIDVQLTGNDGNVFAIIGAVNKALRRSGDPAAVARQETFTADAMSCESYDAVIQLAMRTVNVS